MATGVVVCIMFVERPVKPTAGQTGGRSTQQYDRQHIGAVKVSAVLVDVTPELVEEPVPTSTTGDDGDTKYMSPPVWQTVLGSGLSVREEAAAGVDCYDSVVREPTSVLDSGVGFVAVAGVASLAVAGVASMADAGEASLANAGVASPSMTGVVSLADLAVRDRRGALDGSVCGDCYDGSLGYRNDEDPGDWGWLPWWDVFGRPGRCFHR